MSWMTIYTIILLLDCAVLPLVAIILTTKECSSTERQIHVRAFLSQVVLSVTANLLGVQSCSSESGYTFDGLLSAVLSQFPLLALLLFCTSFSWSAMFALHLVVHVLVTLDPASPLKPVAQRPVLASGIFCTVMSLLVGGTFASSVSVVRDAQVASQCFPSAQTVIFSRPHFVWWVPACCIWLTIVTVWMSAGVLSFVVNVIYRELGRRAATVQYGSKSARSIRMELVVGSSVSATGLMSSCALPFLLLTIGRYSRYDGVWTESACIVLSIVPLLNSVNLVVFMPVHRRTLIKISQAVRRHKSLGPLSPAIQPLPVVTSPTLTSVRNSIFIELQAT